MKKKTVALLMSLVLIFGVAVGGTIAWLMDTTEKVVNTFTIGEVDIDISETDSVLNSDKTAYEKSYKMIPGSKLDKDPKVSVLEDSEKCWLFVKIEKGANLDTYISYAIAEGWKELDPSVSGVYYRVVEAADAKAGVSYPVLLGDKVTVKDTVTSADMAKLEAEGAVLPTLTFKAYAIQYENFEPAEGQTEAAAATVAWAEVSK